MARPSNKKPDSQLPLFSQGSRFEEDFFLRTFGDLVRVPDVALTELVANAWDAGAARVDVTIPAGYDEILAVEDDGCGLSETAFSERWMTLAYNRQRHQGPEAEFPAERSGWRRKAYGRNGQGRHGLLCFGDKYEVLTWRDGRSSRFEVAVASGEEPCVATLLKEAEKSGHGTAVSVRVKRRLPDPDRIREVLASRFLHDPKFVVAVNRASLPLTDLPRLTETRDLSVEDPETKRSVKLQLLAIDGEAGRAKHQSGVTFWVGGRLVGHPGWIVGGISLLDGRTRPSRRLTFVVKTDDLFDEVLPDWSGFRESNLMTEVNSNVSEAVQEILRRLLSSRAKETAQEVLSDCSTRLNELPPGEQLQVAEMVESITAENPLLSQDAITAAVGGVVQAKIKSSPQLLFQKIMALPAEDVAALDRLLDEWTVRDAMTVLDEIGRRIKTIEVLQKLVDEPAVDELHVIHPLVTQARWLFGPEFESPLYTSNVTLQSAVKKLFGKTAVTGSFHNPKKRPDLVFLPSSTLSVVGSEEIDEVTSIAVLKRVVIVELKRGGFKIGRDEMNQADGYIQDFARSGLLDGPPHFHSFVVGREIAEHTEVIKTLGNPEYGRVQACTFGQLIRTANARLFRLRDQVQDRYPETGMALLDRILKEPSQMELLGMIQKGLPGT